MSDCILQVWTAPRCQSGAEPIGPIAQVTSGTVVEALSGGQGPMLDIPRAVADAAGLRAGAWLWIAHPLRGVSEWPILTVDTGDGRSRDVVRVQGGTMRQAIALRGTVRTVNTYGPITTAYTLAALTPSQILTTYVLTNLAADNLDWLTLGTIDYDGTIALGSVDAWTRAQFFDAIEQATGYRIVLVATSSGYRIDLRNPATFAAELDTELLAPGVTVDDIQRTEDLLSAATVAEPRATDGSAMRDTWWSVSAITGSGPYRVTLTDPAGGPAVIREDDEVNGWYLRPNDGLPIVIADSFASDSSVSVASITGVVVGDLVSLHADDVGRYYGELASPSGVALRGRVVVPVSVAVSSTLANRIVDPALRGGLAGWERINPTTGGADVFRRDDPTTEPFVVNGAVSGGATSMDVDGGEPGAVVRFGDAILVAGTDVDASATAITDASGNATVSVSPNLPLTIAGDTLMAWTRDGVNVGTATTNGTQSSGASSLSLKGLTATPQLASGDTLIGSSSGTWYMGEDYVNYNGVTIPGGTTFAFVEARTIFDPVTLQTRIATYEWTGTTVGSTLAGATATISEAGRPAYTPPNEDIRGLTGTAVYTVTVTTLTLSGAQPAWSTTPTATAALSGTTSQTAGTRLEWLRSGVGMGTVEVTSTTVASASLPLTLLNGYTRVLSGDTFALPAQTLYSAGQVVLDSGGAGTISLRVAASAIADNTAARVERCRDYAATAFGGPNVLRLRGDRATFPTTYKGHSEFAIYSPIMRVQSPDPTSAGGGAYYGHIGIGITRWAAESGQTQSGWYAVWDVDTGTQLTVGAFTGAVAPNYSPLFNVPTHTAVAPGFVSFGTAPRRVRVSLHPSGGQSAAIGGYTFLRYVSLTVSNNGALTAALVDGAFSNQLFHRAHDVLDAGRDISRYRVTLTGRAAQELGAVVPGQTARLRSSVLGVDAPLRIARVVWSLRNTDRMELEVAALTPRLSEVV